jgi:hypothetical protein
MKKLAGSNYSKRDNVWYSKIIISGKVKTIGSFKTDIEASEAYFNFKDKLIKEQINEKYREYIDIPEYEGMYMINVDGKIISCIKPIISELNPRLNSSGYLVIDLNKDKNKKTLYIHRLLYITFIGNILAKMEIDHIDRNRVNNKLDNLRLATRTQNEENKNSKGYYFDARINRWYARIVVNGSKINLGYFKNENDAKGAYVSAKRIYHNIDLE